MGSRLVHSKKVRGGGRAPPTAQPPPPVTIFHPNTPKTCSFLPKPHHFLPNQPPNLTVLYPNTPNPHHFPPNHPEIPLFSIHAPPCLTIFHPTTPKTCSFLPKPSIFYPTTPKPLRFPPKPTARPPPPHLSPFQNGDGFVDTDAKLQRIVAAIQAALP